MITKEEAEELTELIYTFESGEPQTEECTAELCAKCKKKRLEGSSAKSPITEQLDCQAETRNLVEALCRAMSIIARMQIPDLKESLLKMKDKETMFS